MEYSRFAESFSQKKKDATYRDKCDRVMSEGCTRSSDSYWTVPMSQISGSTSKWPQPENFTTFAASFGLSLYVNEALNRDVNHLTVASGPIWLGCSISTLSREKKNDIA